MQYLPIIVIVVIIAIAAFAVEKRTSFLSRRQSPIQLQTWGEQNLSDSDVRQWLANLTPQEAKQLLYQLNQFCKQEKLDLKLLFQDKFGNNEELRRQAANVIHSYLKAAWQRAKIRDDLAAHLFFTGYEKSPKKRKYRDFALDLYLQLIQADLVQTPSLADSIMANERKQQKAAQTAILQVARENRPAFNAVLKSALQGNRAVE